MTLATAVQPRTETHMLKIDKGVPMPKPAKTERPAKYPFSVMEVGDSFLVEGKTATAFAAQLQRAGRDYGRKFALRTVDGGIRVWRTA